MEDKKVVFTREEIEAMVDARIEHAILKYHNENSNVLHLIRLSISDLKERIIGIDGNGTGRIGAVQRIERTLEAQNKFMVRIFLGIMGAVGMALLAVVGTLCVEYIKFHSGWGVR